MGKVALELPWFILTILVSIIVGLFVMVGIYHALPPRTQIINQTQTQDVHTENTSIQSSEQAQVTTTLITERTNYSLHVQYNGKTNFSHLFTSKTNRSSRTNENKPKPIIKGIPIP